MSGTCVAEVLLPCVWHIRQQSRAGTIWKPTGLFLHIYRDLGQGPGSGSVDRQCNSSEISSGDITGSSPPCGRYCAVGPAVSLLICVWIRAALCTSCMVEPYWLTMALRYLHARTAARLVFGPSSA